MAEDKRPLSASKSRGENTESGADTARVVRRKQVVNGGHPAGMESEERETGQKNGTGGTCCPVSKTPDKPEKDRPSSSLSLPAGACGSDNT
jgi:hypothetical protein